MNKKKCIIPSCKNTEFYSKLQKLCKSCTEINGWDSKYGFESKNLRKSVKQLEIEFQERNYKRRF